MKFAQNPEHDIALLGERYGLDAHSTPVEQLIKHAVEQLASDSRLRIGSCLSYGGLSAGTPWDTELSSRRRPLSKALQRVGRKGASVQRCPRCRDEMASGARCACSDTDGCASAGLGPSQRLRCFIERHITHPNPPDTRDTGTFEIGHFDPGDDDISGLIANARQTVVSIAENVSATDDSNPFSDVFFPDWRKR